MAKKMDDLSVAKRDVREIRDILKHLKTCPVPNLDAWEKKVDFYKAELKKANALVKKLQEK